MTYFVRGGVAAIFSVLCVVFIFTQNHTVSALAIANDSQTQLKNNDIETVELGSLFVDGSAETISEALEAAAGNGAGADLVTGMNGGSFSATAYCLKGRTALGHAVRRGIVAADPRILRLGSKISLSAGSYSGQYLVSDTGGAVRGRRLDIWVPSCAEAVRFGRRAVGVSVL